MKTKNLLTLCLFCGALLATTSAQAQGMDPAQMKERMIASYTEILDQLDLTDEQKEKVDPILETAVDKRLEEMNKLFESGSFEGFREMMEKQEAELAEQLGEVLSETQLTTFKELREKQLEEMRQRMGGY